MWQKSVTRDGKIWAAPYRWGTTVIIYRQDLLREKNIKPPTDWGDLWREEFKQKISLLNQSREVIGLTLKKLGYSYNQPNINEIRELKSNLQKLHQQTKFYTDDTYLQPLLMGDTLVAVGWSDDIVNLVSKNPRLAAIVPQSGTSIWADLWVKPVNYSTINDQNDQLGKSWIDFCWQRKSADQITLFTSGTSPILTNLNRSEISQDITKSKILLPNQEIISHSEFLQPLNEVNKQQYQTLWKDIRGHKE
jgi:putative spermidine/putrescine transport system substrate-binding protein